MTRCTRRSTPLALAMCLSTVPAFAGVEIVIDSGQAMLAVDAGSSGCVNHPPQDILLGQTISDSCSDSSPGTTGSGSYSFTLSTSPGSGSVATAMLHIHISSAVAGGDSGSNVSINMMGRIIV